MQPFVEGIFIGLGVALPVGVGSLLVMDLGGRRGRAPAMAAGTGIATAYLIHGSIAAVIATVASSFVETNAELLLLVGGLTLVVFGLAGLYRFRTRTEPRDRPEDHNNVGTYVVYVGLALTSASSLFLFAAAVLGRSGDLIASTGDKISYLLGAFLAALAWMGFMAAFSSSTNHYLPSWSRVLTRLVGSLIVLILGMQFVLDVF